MPNFKTGDMWNAWDDADLFLITTNAVVKSDYELVMGRGMALEAYNHDPQIALYFGHAVIRIKSSQSANLDLGLVIPDLWPYRKEGMFQTKKHWRDRASTELIRMSTDMLIARCKTFPNDKVHLNYPGIGNGRLSREIVEPIIAVLPDIVTIWSKE